MTLPYTDFENKLCPCLQYAEIDQQQYQLRMHHDPCEVCAHTEADYQAVVASGKRGRPHGFDIKSERERQQQEAADPTMNPAMVRKVRKR